MQAESLKRIIFILCMVAPWSLLWLDSGLIFPYETGKAWLFRAIVATAFSLLIVYRLAYRRTGMPGIRRSRHLRLWQAFMLAFLIWTGLTNIFGIDGYRSFWSNYERMSGYMSYLGWAAYLLCLIEVLNKRRTRLLMLNLLGVMLAVGLLGLLETQDRAISTLGNPIYLGNMAVFAIFIGGFLLSGADNSVPGRALIWKLCYLMLVLIMLLVLLKTASRGPVLALLSGGLVVLLRLGFDLYARQQFGRLIYLAGLVTLLMGLMLGMNQSISGWLQQSDHYALQRLGRISLSNQTTADRLQNWSIALDASSEHPLMGWGQENYEIAFHEHYRAGVMDNAKLWFDRAHNAYLDILLASGYPGLFFYLMLIVLPFITVLRHTRWRPAQQAFMLGLLSALMTKNLVGFDTFSSLLVWISAAAVIWLSAAESSEEGVFERQLPVGLLLLAALAAASLMVNKLSLQPYLENRVFAEALDQPLSVDNVALQRLLSLPAADLKFAPNAKLAVFQQMLRRRTSHISSLVDEQAVFGRLNRQAAIVVNEELKRQPRNARISYNGAMLLASQGRYTLAVELLESILNRAPQRTAIWYQLGQIYDAAGQVDEAQKAYAQQTSLNPNWGSR